MKVCNKVSLYENCQRQSCTAFVGQSIPAKMIVRGDLLYLKLWIKLTALTAASETALIPSYMEP